LGVHLADSPLRPQAGPDGPVAVIDGDTGGPTLDGVRNLAQLRLDRRDRRQDARQIGGMRGVAEAPFADEADPWPFDVAHHNVLITRAGMPTARDRGGMSSITRLPAPMQLPSPIVTPPRTITRAPIHTLSPMTIGFDSGHSRRRSGSTRWKSLS